MAAWVRDLHFPRLDILITVDAIYQVTPAGPVPAAYGDSLYLSNLDDMVGSRVFTPTVYFYSENNQREPIAKVFRRALANVLVPYYPLSGRLRETIEGKLEVFFGPDQGALMVEARSSLKLADLGDLRVPNPAWAPLIYRFPVEGADQVVNMPLVIAQLTTFSCGGFSLGLRLCHCVCDGLGAMQFVAAWATLAKVGPASKISPSPCWDREFFRPRVPPTVKFPHKEFARMEEGSSLGLILSQAKLVQKCYSVSREFQARLKWLAQSADEDARTGFDAVAAHVWRSWVKAIGIRPLDYELRLSFSVNARPKLGAPPLKEGFYGNALCVACATSTAARLAEGTLSAAAGRVREARVAVSEEYMRSTVDYLETHRPTRLEFAGKLSITQWTRFSMYESSDFGWGRPLYAGPIDLTPTPQICVLLPDGDASGGDGSLVVWICLPEYATGSFGQCLSKLDCDDEM
ncbi:fatty alcohol:caffeoyl-CoA acyltransferase [Aristolochia californica]|uniref:fatty alcohol:caffeoyl-CoA acyltransferase n=1 Tax=Aristolochia californica TaxID=171875 RepID=UPI0035DE5FC6